MIGSTYGDYWNELARPMLESYANELIRAHGDPDRYGDKKTHFVATKPEGCIDCEYFIRVLMLLNGLQYQRNVS